MKKQITRNRSLTFIILFVVIVAILECRIAFTQYESPGDAYEHEHNSTEYQIIEGEKSACIVGGKGTLHVIKSEEKWRIPYNNLYIPKYAKNGNDAKVYVYEYNNLNDYYIEIRSKDKNVVVSDNLGSDFVSVNEHYYGACVTNPNEDYIIYVNEEKHYIFK